ncbi:MAG: DUF1674 domain-containing protein [Proteobacteria bacterium]|nr:DUF1674 domain-containing protein [Pseudomonadota bacterium]
MVVTPSVRDATGVTPSSAHLPPEPESAGKEIGGRGGLEPTRYGDWEKNGRCVDF